MLAETVSPAHPGPSSASLLRADEPLPPRLELVVVEGARRARFDGEGAHPDEVDGSEVVVEAAQSRHGAAVDPQLQRAVAGPRRRGALPIELDEVRPIADGEEPRVRPGAVVPAYASLDAVRPEPALELDRDYAKAGTLGDEDAGPEMRFGLAGIETIRVE